MPTRESANDLVIIDVRGLKCPLPVLKTAKKMRGHLAGARFLVLTTDPMAAIDFPHFCSEEGHTLLSKKTRGTEMRFEIEKGDAPARRAPSSSVSQD